MIEAEDDHIISWTPSGYGFRIHDIPKFRDEVLPKYFRHNKMTSFNKQLNLYGFKKIHHGVEAGSFFHPMFGRDNRDLAADIKLVKYLTQPLPTKPVPQLSSNQAPQKVVAPKPSPVVDDLEIVLSGSIDESCPFQVQQCRELQFKSNFHESCYEWRQILNPSASNPLHLNDDHLLKSTDEVNHKRKLLHLDTYLDAETINYDLNRSNDYILNMIKNKSPCLQKLPVNDMSDLSIDEHVFDNDIIV